MTQQPPPQGWYQDPTGPPNTYRFWSGWAWTEHTSGPGPMTPGYGIPIAPPPPPGYMLRPQVTKVTLTDPDRRVLTLETTFVMIAFLLPGVTSAVILFAQHLAGSDEVTRFPVVISGHPLENMLVGIFGYTATVCTVPLALLLLARTGQGPRVLGLEPPGLRSDIWPAIGIGAAGFGGSIVLAIPFAPLLEHHQSLVSPVPTGSVPHYYVIWGILISAITAVAEEVLMNGYLMTRLSQLGWTPQSALILGIVLRTSYHVYYGIAFIFTIPIAYFLTRSFQKRGRLMRPIVAHFLYDAVLVTIAVFTS